MLLRKRVACRMHAAGLGLSGIFSLTQCVGIVRIAVGHYRIMTFWVPDVCSFETRMK